MTTYRIDGAYVDSRHPKEVHFTNKLEEDLRRRDFTINAMAYNDDVRLVDVFGGMKDLNHHLIRCVGEPKERFSEDALRILRAVRFSAQLNFPIEQNTDALSQSAGADAEKHKCGADSDRACQTSCIASSGTDPGCIRTGDHEGYPSGVGRYGRSGAEYSASQI